MRYFKTQEQAVSLFKQLNAAAETGKVIFIVVDNAKQIKPLINDLAIFLQNKDIRVMNDGIRLKGNKEQASKTIKVVPNLDYIIKGIPATQIIRMEGVMNGTTTSNN